jgi:energy-coupling factor transporter ATP-binding protein EcfA2
VTSEIGDLTVQYHGQEPAVEDLSLRIEDGEFALLTGPSA